MLGPKKQTFFALRVDHVIAAKNIGVRSFLLISVAVSALAQSPWERTATTLGNSFAGPIAKGFSLVAIVVGGLSLAFSEGGGKRALSGIIFGLGMALGASQMLTWLFS